MLNEIPPQTYAPGVALRSQHAQMEKLFKAAELGALTEVLRLGLHQMSPDVTPMHLSLSLLFSIPRPPFENCRLEHMARPLTAETHLWRTHTWTHTTRSGCSEVRVSSDTTPTFGAKAAAANR